MRTQMDELFDCLEKDDIEFLTRNLNKELVNQYRVTRLDQPDYANRRNSMLCFEKQHHLLLFHAMAMKAYKGFQFLLESGADLFSKEVYDRTDFDVNLGKVTPRRSVRETDVALICVGNSKDLRLMQITFDHICTRGLYSNPDCVEFMVNHLDQVNLEKFRLEYLNIDVGSDMPERFDTGVEYKEFLQALGFDVSNLFFSPAEYLKYLTNPSNNIEVKLLERALKVCRFTLEDKKRIFDALPTQELKAVVEEHAPEVNPDFLSELYQVCDDVEVCFSSKHEAVKPQKKSSSHDLQILEPPGSQKKQKLSSPNEGSPEILPPENSEENDVVVRSAVVAPKSMMFGSKTVSEADQKAYDHTKRKIAEAEDSIRKLKQGKKTEKVNRALASAGARLKRLNDDLDLNPCHWQQTVQSMSSYKK